MKQFIKITLLLLTGIFASGSYAATSSHPLADVDIPQDEASLQRGFEIYYNVCRLCHDMKYIKYKNLLEIGMSQQAIDDLRGDMNIMTPMTKTIEDEFVTLLYGQVPPDLSVMAKARKKGPQYIYTLLTTYHEEEGVYDNKLFPGIKMPDILNSAIAMTDEDKAMLESRTTDVTAFLTWAADPRAGDRKRLGVYVIGYLIILSIMLYFIMKRVWGRLDKMEPHV